MNEENDGHDFQAILAGTWKPTNVWGGYKEGMIRLAPLNPAIPKDVVARVSALEKQLTAGTFHPFTGPVVDQDGKTRLASGAMSDADLSKMDYFVAGVASKLPTK